MLDTALAYSGLHTPATGCLQPECAGLAGIKGVRNAHLEKLIMNPGVIGAFIPIVAITFGIGIGMPGHLVRAQAQVELLERLHRERMLALEKGVELPALPPAMVGHLSTRPQSRYLRPRALRNGLMMLLGGIVLYFAVDKAGGEEGALFVLILAVLGLANLVYAAVIWKQERRAAKRRSDIRLKTGARVRQCQARSARARRARCPAPALSS